jgi:hypothetical protein
MTRREFLKAFSLVIAGLSIDPYFGLAGEKYQSDNNDWNCHRCALCRYFPQWGAFLLIAMDNDMNKLIRI